jgi:hypothetical protein
MSEPVLYFVYAVDAGLIASLRDYVHKIVRPKTYHCRLCALTYGAAGQDPGWRCFVDRLPIETKFLHRDEFRADHPHATEQLPAIFLGKDLLVGRDEIAGCKDVETLIDLVRGRIDAVLPAKVAS